jgi:hypothetical protein
MPFHLGGRLRILETVTAEFKYALKIPNQLIPALGGPKRSGVMDLAFASAERGQTWRCQHEEDEPT